MEMIYIKVASTLPITLADIQKTVGALDFIGMPHCQNPLFSSLKIKTKSDSLDLQVLLQIDNMLVYQLIRNIIFFIHHKQCRHYPNFNDKKNEP